MLYDFYTFILDLAYTALFMTAPLIIIACVIFIAHYYNIFYIRSICNIMGHCQLPFFVNPLRCICSYVELARCKKQYALIVIAFSILFALLYILYIAPFPFPYDPAYSIIERILPDGIDNSMDQYIYNRFSGMPYGADIVVSKILLSPITPYCVLLLLYYHACSIYCLLSQGKGKWYNIAQILITAILCALIVYAYCEYFIQWFERHSFPYSQLGSVYAFPISLKIWLLSIMLMACPVLAHWKIITSGSQIRIKGSIINHINSESYIFMIPIYAQLAVGLPLFVGIASYGFLAYLMSMHYRRKKQQVNKGLLQSSFYSDTIMYSASLFLYVSGEILTLLFVYSIVLLAFMLAYTLYYSKVCLQQWQHICSKSV